MQWRVLPPIGSPATCGMARAARGSNRCTELARTGYGTQLARLDADWQKAFIGLTEPEFAQQDMMGYPFKQIGSPIAGLRQAFARDADEAAARHDRLREARPQ